MAYSWVDCPGEHDIDAVCEQISCIGHKFGTKEEDGEAFWKEIDDFLRKEVLPERCLKDDKEKRTFLRKSEQYLICDECLWLKGKKGALPRLVIQDINCRKELINEVHGHCGHQGRDPTYEHLLDRYWWPNIYDTVAYYTRACHPCQDSARLKAFVPYKNVYAPTILRHFHLHTIKMPDGYGGKHYIVQAIDCISGWPEAEAQCQSNWLDTAKFIYKYIISRFSGIPFFTVEHGSDFAGIAEILREKFRVVVLFSSGYYPENSRVVERAQQVLVDSLFKACKRDKSKWPLYLPSALWAIRTTTSRTTGYSPYFMIYGIHYVFSCDLDDATWQILEWDKVQDTPSLIGIRAQQIARRDEVAIQTYRHSRLARPRAMQDFDVKFKSQLSFTDFEVGMWVLRDETWNETGGIGAWRWSGPYIVHEKLPGDGHVLRELDGTVIGGHVGAQRLKLFYYMADQQILRSVSASHWQFIAESPDRKNRELRNFYARYVVHTFQASLSQPFDHLLPIVTYLPGAVHYPTNRELRAPDTWKNYPTVLDLCDKDTNNAGLGAKMARIEAHVAFINFLAEPRFHHHSNLVTMDPAICHSQYHRETAASANPGAYRPCYDF